MVQPRTGSAANASSMPVDDCWPICNATAGLSGSRESRLFFSILYTAALHSPRSAAMPPLAPNSSCLPLVRSKLGLPFGKASAPLSGSVAVPYWAYRLTAGSTFHTRPARPVTGV